MIIYKIVCEQLKPNEVEHILLQKVTAADLHQNNSFSVIIIFIIILITTQFNEPYPKNYGKPDHW